MALTLADVKLVLSGTFGEIDAEDAHWDLVALGAYVTTSVTKTTAALIAGEDPAAKHLKGAAKHGTPVLDKAGLVALLGGATLEAVLSGDALADPPADLEGWSVAIAGSVPGHTRASLATAVERRGATIRSAPSPACDLLLLGDAPSEAAVAAQDAGVPFLQGDALTALLRGAPIADFVARPIDAPDDRTGAVEATLDRIADELVAIHLGEPWVESLTLTVEPSGRAVAELRDLGGTPTHDHVRQVIQRQSWPRGSAPVVVRRDLDFR